MSEEIIEKRTVKGDKGIQMTVNERIQMARFYARLTIGILALGLFGYIVHVMLTMSNELTESAQSILQILLGSFISIISGIATYYYSSGEDIIPDKPQPPPKDTDVSGASSDAAQ